MSFSDDANDNDCENDMTVKYWCSDFMTTMKWKKNHNGGMRVSEWGISKPCYLLKGNHFPLLDDNEGGPLWWGTPSQQDLVIRILIITSNNGSILLGGGKGWPHKILSKKFKRQKSAQKTLNHSHLGAVLGTGLEVKGKKTYLSGIWTHLPNMIGQENSGVWLAWSLKRLDTTAKKYWHYKSG